MNNKTLKIPKDWKQIKLGDIFIFIKSTPAYKLVWIKNMDLLWTGKQNNENLVPW